PFSTHVQVIDRQLSHNSTFPSSNVSHSLLRGFEQARASLVQRQPNAKDRSLSDPALQLDAPAMLAHDPLHDHQTQPGSFLFRRVEGLEDALDLFGWNAAAGI